jgi:sugar O-acyltransferase (sialic acid O-acetyltransferase NeuD family)
MTGDDRRGEAEIVVVGGGEHARVVVDAIRTDLARWTITGYIDPAHPPELEELGLRWLGGDEEASQQMAGRRFIIAVGGHGRPERRVAIAERYDRLGASWGTVVHARSAVSISASVRPGVTVLAGAIINAGARIGSHAIVNSAAVVEHDVTLGEFVHVAPGAVIGGGTSIGPRSLIGLGARVRDHIHIGADVVVGMGAVVVNDVTDRSTVVGVPARAMIDR